MSFAGDSDGHPFTSLQSLIAYMLILSYCISPPPLLLLLLLETAVADIAFPMVYNTRGLFFLSLIFMDQFIVFWLLFVLQ